MKRLLHEYIHYSVSLIRHIAYMCISHKGNSRQLVMTSSVVEAITTTATIRIGTNFLNIITSTFVNPKA